MAKANRVYSGYDSYGRAVHVAERVDGVWFFRTKDRTQWGYSWDKWQIRTVEPVFPDRVPNRCEIGNGPEFVEIPEEDRHLRLEFGFNLLTLDRGPYSVRLPND